MGKIIDAVGKACPMPVILTKKEMDAGEGALEIRVDNSIAVENLKRLADSSGFSSDVEEKDGIYTVLLNRKCNEEETGQKETGQKETEGKETKQEALCGSHAIFVGKEWIGDGDPELGKNLMRMFFYTLTQSEELPGSILFMNGGVKLAALDEEIPGHLMTLLEKGVEVLVCGTCLNFYGITDQLKAGRVSNMYDITEQMWKAGKVITL